MNTDFEDMIFLTMTVSHMLDEVGTDKIAFHLVCNHIDCGDASAIKWIRILNASHTSGILRKTQVSGGDVMVSIPDIQVQR